MDGVHDVGGMDGFGSLPPDQPDDASPFDEPWEGVVHALMATGLGQGIYGIDEFRHAIERQDPRYYLTATYYERWLAAVERLLVEGGVTTPAELSSHADAADRGETPVSAETGTDQMQSIREGLHAAYDSEREAVDPAFEPGDCVTVRKEHPRGHTRCPQYVRGASGRVEARRGAHVLPDAAAVGEERAEPLYNVAFEAEALWGSDCTDGDVVRVDLWESYLRLAND